MEFWISPSTHLSNITRFCYGSRESSVNYKQDTKTEPCFSTISWQMWGTGGDPCEKVCVRHQHRSSCYPYFCHIFAIRAWPPDLYFYAVYVRPISSPPASFVAFALPLPRSMWMCGDMRRTKSFNPFSSPPIVFCISTHLRELNMVFIPPSSVHKTYLIRNWSSAHTSVKKAMN